MPSYDARAFWIVAPGRGELRAEALPPPGDGEVVVRAEYSGISRGTEALVFQGRVPRSEHERMRAPFQSGDFPAPVKYGYASVGRVENDRDGLAGRRVFVLYPHQTRYVVPADAVFPLPDDVPSDRAVLAANLETAINGLWDARPHVGDRVAIVGGGTVGSLAAWLASRIIGCEVELVDVNPRRAEIAGTLGVAFANPASARRDADAVIHASGSADGLRLSLELAGFEATIVELSWYGSGDVPVALGGRFHSQRLTLRSSQVGTVAASQRTRWSRRRRMELAIRLLAHAELDVLVTGESAFEELPDVMPRLTAVIGDTLCHRIRYS